MVCVLQRAVKPVLMGRDVIAQAQSGECAMFVYLDEPFLVGVIRAYSGMMNRMLNTIFRV